MNRKKAIFILCGVTLISVLVFAVICGVETSVRHSLIRSNLPSLAAFIEGYREDKGTYPKSLEELETESKPEYENDIKMILNDQWKDHYEYQLETNGFKIKVEMPNNLFLKHEEFEKQYRIGEVFNSAASK